MRHDGSTSDVDAALDVTEHLRPLAQIVSSCRIQTAELVAAHPHMDGRQLMVRLPLNMPNGMQKVADMRFHEPEKFTS